MEGRGPEAEYGDEYPNQHEYADSDTNCNPNGDTHPDADGDSVTDFITITLDGSRIIAKAGSMGPTLGRNIRLATARAVIELQNYIRTEKLSGQVLRAPTGNLRNAVRAYPPAGDQFPIIGSVAVDRTAPYGKMLEKGTRPHDIRPIRAKALRFTVGGDVRFAKVVHHPGTKPMPFMRPSLAEKRGSIIVMLRAAVGASIKNE